MDDLRDSPLMSRALWITLRMIDLQRAIEERARAGREVPDEWLSELNSLATLRYASPAEAD
jgi:hypothetical protein